MSFMETLLIDKFEVPCQTDPEYKISSNQCSWCAVLFGINYKELLKAYLNDKAEFIKLYKKYLNDYFFFFSKKKKSNKWDFIFNHM